MNGMSKGLIAVLCFVTLPSVRAEAAILTDDQVAQSYIYLLGRLLITRQQQLDFQEGFKWNELVHRKPGAVDWPNPNLDVAYSEAWVAVDETSCTIVTVPSIEDRYYTVQFLNGWGETLANINERLFPNRRSGEFAACLRGATVDLPAGVMRIDLPVKHARILARVALGNDPDRAVELQHQFTLHTTGSPILPDIPKTPIFELEHLPGVDAFDATAAALDSEPDLNPGLEQLQQDARAVAAAIRDDTKERGRIDAIIKQHAFPEIAKAGLTIGHGVIRNGWARPGVVGEYGLDYTARTLVNNGGIWANVKPEVLYYRGGKDDRGDDLTGDHAYKMTFPKDALPSRFAKYFWSVIAVDNVRFRVLANPINRFLLNEQTNPQYGPDGSLTLYFANEKPAEAPDGNWLPIPKGQKFRLTFRFYGPLDGVANGTYWPPALVKLN
ncbi:DUF1214 domain-containing protein [Neorhizobium alkalisoli]|uniref:DUF1254 domain-containing protein n=1 Tax=Neorhizobium alkalisoli TaxID=528178 RepID=A0A561QBX1_9HYPH|nr:DUF1214 domain-containing protein [Neorhizobium alkalisoli]TWF47832.1 hypothetical protein FHW37_110129 [Neorhizobium alkalisoli]